LSTLIQQALYLIISGLLLSVELVEEVRLVNSPFILNRVWRYREPFLHFLLGTLLNSYTIFYFKSASAFTSFGFIAILIALLTLNEFKRFGKSQTQVHAAFFSLCLVSYFATLAPILMGSIGTLPFLTAVMASILIFAGYYQFLNSRIELPSVLLRTHLLFPFVVIHSFFVILYFTHLIPPVPLSVSYMGIFHNVEKKDGEYQLTYTRPRWKFWQHGDQTFEARSGDSIFCFVRVFSPARFHGQLQVRWLFWSEKRGWLPSDAIPMPIVGGREEGYRGVTKKMNYQPGEWRVQIETMDNREVGRIHFTVVPDETLLERELQTEVH
ncbi:MAG: DUF2914 domain-containing protein, partial [Bdellovibrionia bacterium]